MVARGVLAICVVAGAAAQPIVPWDPTAPAARLVSPDGVVSKRLLINDVEVVASVVDQGHSLAVDLDILNASSIEVTLDPAHIELRATRPQPSSVSQIQPAILADHVRIIADRHADKVEARGVGAMTMQVDMTPVVEVTSVPSPTDPTQSTTQVNVRMDPVMNFVPDYAERMHADAKGKNIRRRADVEAFEIMQQALLAGGLASGEARTGTVYFQREKVVPEIVIRIPIGQAIAEIPFSVTEQRGFFKPRRLLFN